MTTYIATRLGNGEDLPAADLPDPYYSNLYDLDPAARNQRRALFAGVGLKAFSEEVGGNETVDTAIGDLLCDLRHLCDALGLDYGLLDDRGHRSYLEELAGE